MNAKLSNEERRAISRRDGYQCAVCGCHRFLQIHHYIPRGHGGTNHPHNLVTLCDSCHAMAHGINLVGHPDLTQEDMEQMIVEYLADLYAPDWYPWGEYGP